MSGHVLRGQGKEYSPQPGQDIPDEQREVSGVLLKLRSPQSGMLLDQLINRQGKTATLAWPVARLVQELFSKLGWLLQLMHLTTVLVLAVAAASITASLCNTLHERRKEFAVLRSLGARRWFVAGVVTLESLWISVIGSVWGIALHLAGMVVVTGWLRAQTGIQFEPLAQGWALLWVPTGGVLMGLLAGLLPTWVAYRGNLAPELSQN